jgi:hypothetical protein
MCLRAALHRVVVAAPCAALAFVVGFPVSINNHACHRRSVDITSQPTQLRTVVAVAGGGGGGGNL